MASRVRSLFWVEACLASAAGLLAVITAAWPDWIEAAFGVDPDGGDGTVEWLVVAVLAAVAVALGYGARREWRRGGPRPFRGSAVQEETCTERTAAYG
jgi:hypothetical protein